VIVQPLELFCYKSVTYIKEEVTLMRRMYLPLLLAVVLLFPMPIMAAQARHHIQDYDIVLGVESMELATVAINALNGYNLESFVTLTGAHPDATFRRRVDSWAFRQVQDMLRYMGVIISETEAVMYFGQEITDLEARLTINSQEIERLSQMMEASDSLEVLILLSDRIGRLAEQRDGILGRRNQLLVQTSNPVINIHLIQLFEDECEPDPEEEEVPPTFLARIGGSFMTSMRWTGTVLGNILMGLAFASAPLVLLAIVGVPVVMLVLRLRKSNVKTEETK